jgi:lipoprotein-anchoring transpeptidase ErfK/SrfK
MQISLLRTLTVAAGTLLLAGFLTASAALANVSVSISISGQTMYVSVDGDHYATWKVSTGRSGYRTPRGSFKPYLLKRMHYSSKYENSPMPHSVFFRGGYAIHGTNYVKRLGRPASHGCIRLAPSNAATLYKLIRRHGMKKTRISIRN